MTQVKKIVLAVAVAGIAALGSTGVAYASTPGQFDPHHPHGIGDRDGRGDHFGHTARDWNIHRGWAHFNSYGWYPGGVSVRQCFQGGGHVNPVRNECVGGRFNDFLVR